MLGIFVILLVSSLANYAYEKKFFPYLGLVPIKTRILQFMLGLLVIWSIYALVLVIQFMMFDLDLKLQANADIKSIGHAVWYHLKSALTEDLVFRGLLLYVLMDKIGWQKGSLLSAIVFGIYHWFSYGMLGSGIIPMLVVFIFTGSMGYVWALAYKNTNSIVLGWGMHFGWNIFSTLFYPVEPYGELLFQLEAAAEITPFQSTIFYCIKGILPPLLIFFFLRRYNSNLGSIIKNA